MLRGDPIEQRVDLRDPAGVHVRWDIPQGRAFCFCCRMRASPPNLAEGG